MKKRTLSIILAATVLASSGAVFAVDKTNPDVYVNGSLIMFDDQPAVIENDRTLVPARGVFEAMNAKVSWDEDLRQVEVISADNKTCVRLNIDDNVMRVYDLSDMISTLLSGENFEAPETDIELDVAPQIMNDRTMVPLRAISEAIDANVEWDGEEYNVIITTNDVPTETEGMPALSLSASSATVAAGETVDIYVNAANIPEGTYVSGVTATVQYDTESFEFVDAVLVNGDTEIASPIKAANPEFGEGLVKAIAVTIDEDVAVKTDGAVMKLTFKSINGEEGSFALSSAYDTKVGYNTSLLVETLAVEGETATNEEYEGTELVISSDVLVINGADAQATTEATTEPEATAAPEATTEATEATAEPTAEATVEPEATAEATEATTAPEATAEATAEPTATPAA
jgi:hypothetical protein